MREVGETSVTLDVETASFCLLPSSRWSLRLRPLLSLSSSRLTWIVFVVLPRLFFLLSKEADGEVEDETTATGDGVGIMTSRRHDEHQTEHGAKRVQLEMGGI